MSDEIATAADEPASGNSAESTEPARARRPWVSIAAVIACVAVFVGLSIQNDFESVDALARWGYVPAASIWQGALWGLVTCAFVHFGLWHLVFNCYWLWVLGRRFERAIGSLSFLAFLLGSAFVTSSCELAASDSPGIGASGMVYAIFGAMWLLRDRFPSFEQALDQRTTGIFAIWLVGCMALTYLEVVDIANAAHLAGLWFGAAATGFFRVGRKRQLMLATFFASILAAVVPLFWCPWSVSWLTIKALAAHESERYREAVDLYSRIIRIDPDDAWAYANRSDAYDALGELEKSQADATKALQLDPSIFDDDEDDPAP